MKTDSRKNIMSFILALSAAAFLVMADGHFTGGKLFAQQGTYDYIDIRNPSLRKIPLAIPLAGIRPATRSEISVRTTGKIGQYLDFTGYFKILDRNLYLENPTRPDTVNFGKWTAIGSELLITAHGDISEDLIEIEMRLFDTVKGELLVGKKYKGWLKDLDRIVRKFCSEVIHHLTGSRGVFDSRIAFISSGTGQKEIYTCDFDGSNPGAVTRAKSITLTPAWSSDGQWLAYTSYEKGRPDLYIRNLDENRGAVVSKKGINTTPAWKPGEFLLAATLSFSGDQDIYLLTGKGKVVKKLTNKWGIDTSPAWSPDGKRLAFVSNRGGSPQIYVKDLASGKTSRLTFEGRYNTQPSWSPMGDKIAYSSIEGGGINIHIMDLKTRTPARLTYNSGQNESPSWSPDGSLIVFSSSREGGVSKIYVMTSYGTDQRKLLDMPGEQTSPKWSPHIGAE